MITSGINLFANELVWDHAVKIWLDNISNPWLDQFFRWVTGLGSPQTLTVLGLLSLVIFLLLHRGIQGMALNLCLLTSWGTMHLLKDFFARPRPPGQHLTYAAGYSFPSGHAMVSMAFYGFLAYLLWVNIPGRSGRCWAALLMLLIFLIGMSRIYLNVHYASDVLGGFLFGGLFMLVFAVIYRRMYPGGNKRRK